MGEPTREDTPTGTPTGAITPSRTMTPESLPVLPRTPHGTLDLTQALRGLGRRSPSRSQRSPSASATAPLSPAKPRRRSVQMTLSDLPSGAMTQKQMFDKRTEQNKQLQTKALDKQFHQAIEMKNLERQADGRAPLMVPQVSTTTPPKMTPRRTSASVPVMQPPTTINIMPAAGAAAARPTAAAPVSAAIAAPTAAKPPVTNRFSMLGAEFKSVGGGKYTVEKPGTMLQPQLEHLAGILSQMDMQNNELFTTRVNNETAYITVRDKGTKQFVAAFPLKPGHTLIPQPKTNDPVDLAKWADQEKAAKQGRTPKGGTTNYKDPSGRITLYRRYKNLLFPPRGIQWTMRQVEEAKLLEAAGRITVLEDKRRQGQSGKIYPPAPTSFNLYTQDAGQPEQRATAPLPAPVRVATLPAVMLL